MNLVINVGKKTIGVVAPSFGATITPYKERLEVAIKNFKELGYNVILGKNVKLSKGLASSNTKEERAKEIMEMWDKADIIMSSGGGEVMCEVLEGLDFNYFKNNPKLFIGFSDNTNLTYTLTTISGIESIYGPNFPSFYTLPLEYDLYDTLRMINNEKEFIGYNRYEYGIDTLDPLPKYNLNCKTNIINHNFKNDVSGYILGGCLDVLIGLCGTRFDNTVNYMESLDDGVIFYMEACDLTSVGVIRALFQLKNANWFKNVKCFLIGRSNNLLDESFGVKIQDAYIYSLGELNIPMLINIDLGHISPSIPMLNGRHARVSYINNTLKILYDEKKKI